MTVNDVITLGLDITHLNAVQVPAAKSLIYLNAVYQDCVAGITQHVGEDFFLGSWEVDAVADQTDGEYSFTAASATVAGLRKIKQLSVKVNGDVTYFTKARQVDWRALLHSWDWYLANQPTDDPIYIVGDTSFFLAPNFTSDTTDGGDNNQILIRGIKSAVDLVAGGAETTILVPREYHAKVLGKGLAYWHYKHVGKAQDASAAMQEYEYERRKMFAELTDRDISLFQATLPGDVDMQY